MNKQIAKLTIADLSEGDTFTFEQVLTEKMVDHFSSLSGDFSRIHTEEGFAKEKGFKGRLAHGVLLTGLLSRLVGMHLPGENALLQSMNTKFLSPVFIGDTVRVTGQVEQVSEAAKSIVIQAVIENKTTKEAAVKSKIQVGLTQ